MNWTFSVKNKIKASITLLLLCGIVFFSNYRLKQLSSRVAVSVQTIFEDRLVVQDIIYSYSKILSQLETLEGNNNQHLRNTLATQADQLNERYATTVFTEEEASLFKSFANNLEALIEKNSNNSDSMLLGANQDLNRLEQIQMEEARKQMLIIEEAKGSQEISFSLETAILLILLVIVQLLVVSSTSIQKVAKEEGFTYN